ncbi:phosphoglucosamine mutase [bacterium]|nr:phosphoglucosamine mutase [bacterium]
MSSSFFGTDGIRARVGTSLLTPDGMIKLGIVLGTWITHNNKLNSVVFVGQDTRNSSDLLVHALITGLLHESINVQILGVTPTPILEHITAHTNGSYGIMITASHNKYHDNGIKLFKHSNGHAQKLTPEEELEISTLLQNYDNNNFTVNYEQLGTCVYLQDTLILYKKFLEKNFKSHFLKDTKIILDCANGAYSTYAPELFCHFGAQVIAINNAPNGKNINENCGALYPEHLHKTILKENAQIGFAFDGDGDRLIMVTQDGLIYSGDDTLALLMQHPAYKDQQEIVGTVMTNEGLAHYAQSQNKKFIRTPVGDKYVAQALVEHNLLLGGESSGHTLLRDLSDSSDGLLTAFRILETMILHNWSLKSFTKLPHYTLTMPITIKKDLTKEPYATIIKEHESIINGRLLVRYSGTEPVLRIMVEDSTECNAKTVALKLSQQLAFHL